MVLWGDEALKTDHIGFYSKNELVNPVPTAGHFHEQYPHQIGAWMYDEQYVNSDFNYEDLEQKWTDAQNATASNPADMKAQLDQAHKH